MEHECILCGKSGNRNICPSCRQKIRRYLLKEAAILLLGGKCVDCGKVFDQACFEFHHNGNKDFQVGNVSQKSWEVIRKEVLKCVLLCSNCHRLRHSTRSDPKFLAIVRSYKGRDYLLRKLKR